MNKTNKLLHLSVKAGQILLENGSETSRVQETVRRILHAHGITESDTFAMPTGIFSSLTDKNGETYSLIRRIPRRSINLEKISRINALSFSLNKRLLLPEEIETELESIGAIKHYRKTIDLLFAGLATGSCTLLFGGSLMDLPAAFAIGVIVKGLSLLLSKVRFNEFFTYILGGAIAAFLALAAVHFGLAQNVDKVIIGSIMLLVPGLIIVNGIRDTLSGDLVAGISRIAEAVIVALAIAAGTGMVLKLWHYLPVR